MREDFLDMVGSKAFVEVSFVFFFSFLFLLFWFPRALVGCKMLIEIFSLFFGCFFFFLCFPWLIMQLLTAIDENECHCLHIFLSL